MLSPASDIAFAFHSLQSLQFCSSNIIFTEEIVFPLLNITFKTVFISSLKTFSNSLSVSKLRPFKRVKIILA